MISSESEPRRSAVFFDRDGVVNRRRIDDYVKEWTEFEFLPEVFSVLPRVHDAGYLAVLVTNQRGIARGLMTLETLEEIHTTMQRELRKWGSGGFDAIYFCPHGRDAGCACRKPLPGMLLQAAREHRIDLAASWMIGDSESDIEAGRAAGCRTILISDAPVDSTADAVVRDLDAAWRLIETGHG
jgi:D-glycero-D-manno-heptose 1,7-bisphosphate phosphatase